MATDRLYLIHVKSKLRVKIANYATNAWYTKTGTQQAMDDFYQKIADAGYGPFLSGSDFRVVTELDETEETE